MLASASEGGEGPTALTQAAPNILLPSLGPVSPYLLSGQLFTYTGLSGGETMCEPPWGPAQPCWGSLPRKLSLQQLQCLVINSYCLDLPLDFLPQGGSLTSEHRLLSPRL